MKKPIAVVLIAFFALMTLAIPSSFSHRHDQLAPGDSAGLLGYLVGAVVFPIAGLFFSVRWYLSLSQHTHKTSTQAWLYILRPYAFLGILLSAVFIIQVKEIVLTLIGVLMIAFWIWTIYACTKWLKYAHAVEAGHAITISSITKKPLNPAPYILFVLLVLVLAIGVSTSSPQMRRARADRELKSFPFYKAISEADPQTYEKMLAITADGVNKGQSVDATVSQFAPIVSEMLPKFVGAASDESVITMIDVVVRRVSALHSARSDACYFFLFPNESGAPPMSSYSDEKTNNDSLDAMYSIVQSAVHHPQPTPDAARAEALLAPAVKRLRNTYGDDLRLFKQKPVDSAGRQRVCEITVSLYRNVEGLPKSDASVVLRYLLSNQTTTAATRQSKLDEP